VSWRGCYVNGASHPGVPGLRRFAQHARQTIDVHPTHFRSSCCNGTEALLRRGGVILPRHHGPDQVRHLVSLDQAEALDNRARPRRSGAPRRARSAPTGA